MVAAAREMTPCTMGWPSCRLGAAMMGSAAWEYATGCWCTGGAGLLSASWGLAEMEGLEGTVSQEDDGTTQAAGDRGLAR